MVVTLRSKYNQLRQLCKIERFGFAKPGCATLTPALAVAKMDLVEAVLREDLEGIIPTAFTDYKFDAWDRQGRNEAEFNYESHLTRDCWARDRLE